MATQSGQLLVTWGSDTASIEGRGSVRSVTKLYCRISSCEDVLKAIFKFVFVVTNKVGQITAAGVTF